MGNSTLFISEVLKGMSQGFKDGMHARNQKNKLEQDAKFRQKELDIREKGLMHINLQQIATVKSPFCDLVNMPVQPRGAKDICATIEFKEEYEEGLKDLDGFSHVYLIYYFHKVKEPKLSVIPFNDKTHTLRGVFSTRTPMHPNSLGLSVVELVKVEGNIVTIKGVDILDGTPLLDIKP